MTLRCLIETGEPTARLRDVFATELAREHQRSRVTLSSAGGKGAFRIEADDVTSLRAAINGVMGVLVTHMKVLHEL